MLYLVTEGNSSLTAVPGSPGAPGFPASPCSPCDQRKRLETYTSTLIRSIAKVHSTAQQSKDVDSFLNKGGYSTSVLTF